MEPKYENLIFSGGGVLSTSFIGALEVLQERGHLQHIKKFAGSSGGSILAVLLALNANIEYLHKTFKTMKFTEFQDNSWTVLNLNRLRTEFGYYSGNNLLQKFRNMIKDLTGNPDFKFKDLPSDRSLIITGTHLNKRKTVYFSREETPDLCIADALRISCSFPIYFTAVKKSDGFYVDGGLLMNLPLHVFQGHKTLGLKLLHSDEIKYNECSITNIAEYGQTLIEAVYNQCQKSYVHRDDWERIVKIPVGDMSAMNFNITEAQLEDLIEKARVATREFLDQ